MGYAVQAVECLAEAVKLGYTNVVALEADPDLASIRQEEGYRKLVDQLKGSAGPSKPGP